MRGGAETCDCLFCQNFRPQREAAYPDSFKSLLEQIGIDLEKEGEVYMSGPVEDGYYVYEGHFYLIGEMIIAGESTISGPAPHRLACFFAETSRKLEEFKGEPLLAIEFVTRVKWELPDDPESGWSAAAAL